MSAASIVASLLFGSIGLAAFIYGKKQSRFNPLVIGSSLMAYPVFIQNTKISIAVGLALTASLFFFRS